MLTAIIIVAIIIVALIAVGVIVYIEESYRELEKAILDELGFPCWDIFSYIDRYIYVKSRQALDKYDDIKFFKEDNGNL